MEGFRAVDTKWGYLFFLLRKSFKALLVFYLPGTTCEWNCPSDTLLISGVGDGLRQLVQDKPIGISQVRGSYPSKEVARVGCLVARAQAVLPQ